MYCLRNIMIFPEYCTAYTYVCDVALADHGFILQYVCFVICTL